MTIAHEAATTFEFYGSFDASRQVEVFTHPVSDTGKLKGVCEFPRELRLMRKPCPPPGRVAQKLERSGRVREPVDRNLHG
jgi:hypothetical protein